jgi:hypothetical protein
MHARCDRISPRSRHCPRVQVQRLLPPALLPYSALGRWDRPIGTHLLLWPCLWSTALAAAPGTLPDAHLCGLFAVGAFVMRGAGCTANDLWDRDIDRQVMHRVVRDIDQQVMHPCGGRWLVNGGRWVLGDIGEGQWGGGW